MKKLRNPRFFYLCALPLVWLLFAALSALHPGDKSMSFRLAMMPVSWPLFWLPKMFNSMYVSEIIHALPSLVLLGLLMDIAKISFRFALKLFGFSFIVGLVCMVLLRWMHLDLFAVVVCCSIYVTAMTSIIWKTSAVIVNKIKKKSREQCAHEQTTN